MNINFKIADISQHVELKLSESTHHTNDVLIGGKRYSLQGNSEALHFVKNCFDDLPVDSRLNLEQVGKELKSRLWLNGAKNVTLSTVSGTHKIGMSILGKNEEIDIPAIINKVCEVFEESYVFPDIAEKCANYLRQQMSQGAYDAISDGDAFTEAVLADLRLITEDKHVAFYVHQKMPELQSEDTIQTTSSTPISEQYTIPKLFSAFEYKAETAIGWMGATKDRFPYEIKTGYLDEGSKIGYIDFRIFGVTSEQDSDSSVRRQAIIKAVQNISKANSVIIDLRNNSGGNPSTVQLLCSLFIEEGLPLNTIVYRGEPRDYATLSHEELPVEKRMTTPELFVLIGPNTFSAAEEFSNNIKVLNRGTIVGEPSGGGANPGGTVFIGEEDKFVLFIPSGKAVNPIQGGNWEGVGILPDHMVLAEEALDEAMRHI